MRNARIPFIIICVASLIQLIVAAQGPLDGDETLYWEWSRHLAWGYFDHPPGIALLIRIGVSLFGVSAFGVRVVPVLASLGGAIFTVLIARRHGGTRAALYTALIVSCAPILTTWLLLATPDTALYLTAMASLYAVDRALAEPSRSGASFKWWTLAGVALGLAVLSKEFALLIPFGIVIALATHPALRHRLAEPGPYVACLIAGVIALPVILWNAQHDWISIQFAMQRGLGSQGELQRSLDEGGTWSVFRVGQYIAGQAGMVSPVLFILMAMTVTGDWRSRLEPRRHVLATSALVTFGCFAVVASRHAVEANWAMLAYPPAAITLGVAAANAPWRRWLTGGLLVGGVAVAIMYVHMVVPVLGLAQGQDPIRRGHGWDSVATQVQRLRDSVGTRSTWIAGNRFQDASELAFTLRDHPEVFSLNLASRANQYDFWPRFADRASRGDRLLLLLDDGGEDFVAVALARHFTGFTKSARIAHPALSAKRVWILDGWRGTWPGVESMALGR